MKKIHLLIPTLFLAAVAIVAAPHAVFAAPNCGNDFGCWFGYAMQQQAANVHYPQGVFNEPQAVPATTPTDVTPANPDPSQGKAGTAKVCSAFLFGNSDCVILSATEAAAKVQGLVDLANSEASVNKDCNPGMYGYYDQCDSSIPPPTISYDSQGRIISVACGNGGATAQVTYYDPSPSPAAGPACAGTQGNACTATNSCAMGVTGVVLCDGSCSAVAPSDALCKAAGTPAGAGGNGGAGAGGGGGGNGGAGVNANPAPAAPAAPVGPSPTNLSVRLFADPASVMYGLFSTLTWSSTDAVSCTGSPTDFAHGDTGNATGVKVTPFASTLYVITCTDKNGDSTYDSRKVTVLEPDLSITASPAMVRAGSQSVISWSMQGKADSCRISGPDLESTEMVGSVPKTINATSVYTISCTAGVLHPTKSVTVEVIPAFREI